MSPAQRKLRVLIANPSLDVHEAGTMIIATALKNAGFEVVYLGIRQPWATIARAAIQEDVDAIGLGMYSGAHGVIVPKLLDYLRANGAGDITVVCGGVIPVDDIPALKAAGVKAVFPPGSKIETILDFFRGLQHRHAG